MGGWSAGHLGLGSCLLATWRLCACAKLKALSSQHDNNYVTNFARLSEDPEAPKKAKKFLSLDPVERTFKSRITCSSSIPESSATMSSIRKSVHKSPYTDFNLDDMDSLLSSHPGKALLTSPPSAPVKMPATRAKASTKRKRTGESKGSLNQLEKTLHDQISEGLALVRNQHAQDMSSLEKEVFGLRSSLAAKDKENAKLLKQLRSTEEDLMYTQA